MTRALSTQSLTHRVGWALWPILQIRKLRLGEGGGLPEATQPVHLLDAMLYTWSPCRAGGKRGMITNPRQRLRAHQRVIQPRPGGRQFSRQSAQRVLQGCQGKGEKPHSPFPMGVSSDSTAPRGFKAILRSMGCKGLGQPQC